MRAIPLEVIVSGMDLEEAIRLMFQKKIKKMPVVDNESIRVLVSLTDIARSKPAIIKLLKTLLQHRTR